MLLLQRYPRESRKHRSCLRDGASTSTGSLRRCTRTATVGNPFPLLKLPVGIIQYTLSYLTFQDILSVKFTSKYLNRLTRVAGGSELFPASSRREHIKAVVARENEELTLDMLANTPLLTCSSCGRLKRNNLAGFDNSRFCLYVGRTCMDCIVRRDLRVGTRLGRSFRVMHSKCFPCVACRSILDTARPAERRAPTMTFGCTLRALGNDLPNAERVWIPRCQEMFVQ
jgi:hypothetical protein